MYIIIKAFLDDLIDFCYKGTVEPDMLAKYHRTLHIFKKSYTLI